MLTINAETKKEEKRRDKTYNVKFRFTLNRKYKRISTSLFVTPKDLTKDFKIKTSSPIYREIDSLIRSYQEKCSKLQIEQNGYTIEDVMDCIRGEQAKKQVIDFIKFSPQIQKPFGFRIFYLFGFDNSPSSPLVGRDLSTLSTTMAVGVV